MDVRCTECGDDLYDDDGVLVCSGCGEEYDLVLRSASGSTYEEKLMDQRHPRQPFKTPRGATIYPPRRR
jgi:uncharacterized Zn finger protein (UPF0148 family)